MNHVKEYVQSNNLKITGNLKVVLDRVEQEEKQKNKSIEKLNEKELVEFLKGQNYNTLQQSRAFLNKYFDWLVSKEYINENIFADNKNLSIKSINALKEKERKDFNEEDFEILMLNLSMYTHLQFIVYACWLGISFPQLAKIKRSDLNFNKKVVNIDDIEFPIDDRFIELWKEYDSNSERYGKNPSIITNYKNFILKIKLDARMRDFTCDNDFIGYCRLQYKKYVNEVFNDINCDLSLSSIKKYGRIHAFIKQAGNVNSENLYSKVDVFCKERGYSNNRFYTENYEYFKKVFNLE